MTSPFTRRGLGSRSISLALAGLTVLTPCAILTATLPGNGKNGFVDIGSFWLWHDQAKLPSRNSIRACLKLIPRTPHILLDGSCVRIFLVVACGVIAAALVVAMVINHADHGLLFGSVTALSALTAAAACVSVFARKHIEDQAGRMFALLAALSIILLVLAAHDWARRQLVVAALVVAAALSIFIVRVGFERLKVPPQWERAQIASHARATEDALTLERKRSQPAKPVSAKALNQAICVIDPPRSGKCPTGPVTAITTNRVWVTDRHELDVELASYRAQVTGTKADQAALQAVLERQPDADEDISMMAAIENGPKTLWRSAFHEAGPALVPGPLGWAVFGILLLGLLSWLLKVNASQLAGPVMVDDVKSGDGNDQLTAALRVAVLQNVAEPGAAPGSPSTNPVTTLLDIAGGPLSAANKIVQAIQAVAGQRYGYRVTIDVTTGNLAGSGLVSGKTGAIPSGPAETTVLVRVMSLTSGVTYTSHLCEAPDPLQAVQTAGLWAAGYILNRSSRIPHWAAWEAETAHALVTAKSTAEHTIPDLQAALASAPNSGILLVLLGHQFELEGQMLDAITCYARAVTAYPRYFVARYRLAAALALMRHARDWRLTGQIEAEDDMRRAVTAAVRELELRDGSAITDMTVQNPDRTAFADLARTLLRALEFDTRWDYRLAGVLRRSERESIWPALTPFSQHPAARFPGLVRSARQALGDDETQLCKLYEKADKPGGWWQISYNAACVHATKIVSADSEPPPADTDGREAWKEKNDEQAGLALDFLEQTLVRMGVEQLSAEWVSRDADLAMLRDLPRFNRFLAQLRSGG